MKNLKSYSFNFSYSLFVGFVILLSFNVSAKTLNKVHFTTNDGLPSSEIYCSYQDQRGFIWFGTDRGVARFDGQKFKIFTTNDGLTDNVVFNIYGGPDGKIWFGTYTGGFCFYQSGKIIPYQFNHFFKNWEADKTILSMYSDSLGNMEFSFKGVNEVIQISHTGELNILNAAGNAFHFFRILNNSFFFYNSCESYCNKVKFQLNNLESEYKFDIEPNIDLNQKISKNGNITEHGSFLCASYDALSETVYAPIVQVLFKFNQAGVKLVKHFDKRILSICKLGNRIIVGFYKGGYSIIDVETNEVLLHEDLNENSISSIQSDNDDGLWLTTLENGLFYIPQINNFSLTIDDNLSSNYILNITGNENELAMVDGLGSVTFFSLKKDSVVKILAGYNRSSRSTMQYDKSHDQFYLCRNEAVIIKDKRILNVEKRVVDLWVANQDSILCFKYFDKELKFGHINNVGVFFLWDYIINTDFLINTRNIFKTKSNRILYGATNGLFELRNNEIVYLGNEHNYYKSRVSDIESIVGYDFCFGTRDIGLVLVKGDKVSKIGKKDGLLSDQIITMAVDEYTQSLWIGTSEGISVLKSDQSITNYRLEDGLLSEEINEIFVNKEKAYVATKKGVTIIDKSKGIDKTANIPVYFESITINNREEDLFNVQTIEIPYNTSFIEINCVGISFKNRKDLRYSYRLKNKFDNWNISKNGSIVFTSLAPGKYDLEVVASVNGVDWSTIPAELTINIPPPIWQTLAFKIITFILAIMLIIIIIKVIVSRVKKKNNIILKENALKMGALNAQMNPHFIFNALNSVQNFIMKNEKKDANRYLSKFSKLMRKVLMHSEKVSIPLQDEIEALKLYLDLEILRFDDQISYHLNISENINQSQTLLPTLLLQPIVENSIWHGIRPKTGNGHITINIKDVDDKLSIIIEDDGVGLSYKEEKKTRAHISKGINLIEQRIDLFSRAYNTKSSYEQIDLSNISNKTGTRVSITLPLIKRKT